MKKITKEDMEFQKFQTWFTCYQQKFGLTGYKVYFQHEPLKDCFANITIDQPGMVATVRLNSEGDRRDLRDVRQSAKHEALHLLLYRLEDRACHRYIRQEEVFEASEELVFKLENLIE